MKRKFWQWVYDRLESAQHWVYRTKLAREYKFVQECGCLPQNSVQTVPDKILYWSKNANLNEYPKMEPVSVDYYRVNPDGSFTLLDGPTDTAVIR